MGIDIFNYNMLLMPFHNHGETSLFAIVGAKYIRDYTKNGFFKNRPCILHFQSCNSSYRNHDDRQAADRLRTWLNCLWQNRMTNDPLSMPFQKRTMPLCHPIGMLLNLLSVLYFQNISLFMLNFQL